MPIGDIMKEKNNDIDLRKEDNREKKYYKKPLVNTVQLLADQALSSNCSFSSGPGCNDLSLMIS